MAADRARRGYLGGPSDLMIVDQEGERLVFTTYRRRGAKSHDVLVSRRTTGALGVRLRKENGAVWLTAFE
jgi:hypothetical protein